ncbi:hypothetical protein ACFWZ1_16080 [Frateuria sp. GZRe14]
MFDTKNLGRPKVMDAQALGDAGILDVRQGRVRRRSVRSTRR